MASKKKLLQAAAGSAGGAGLDVDEVFSTYLYDGNSSSNTATTQQITNNIDLSGEGGLVWIKKRNGTSAHALVDSARGGNKELNSAASTDEKTADSAQNIAFNTDGFTMTGWYLYNATINKSGEEYTSWTFRKAPKFFDVVTYTGTGSTQNISHNLGAVPAVMMVKSLSSGSRWNVYHKDASPNGTPQNGRMALNTTDAWGEHPTVSVFQGLWNNTAPTDSVFTVGSYNDTNGSGQNFVAYLFAHNNNDGEFGPDSDQDIIKCGSYTGNGTAGHVINLGFEAQWVLVKKSDGSESWIIYDAMRGMPVDGNGARIRANDSEAESSITRIGSHAQGFQLSSTDGECNINGGTYIYMAIRRGPLAAPESATDVFAIDTFGNASSTAPTWEAGFPVDMEMQRNISSTANMNITSRLTSNKFMRTNLTSAEASNSSYSFDYQNGWGDYAAASNTSNYSWMWKRAPSYFDVVAYTGNGNSPQNHNHNLGVAPEMMWVRRRNSTGGDWAVYHKDLPINNMLYLNTSDSLQTGKWASTAPTSSVFTTSGDYRVGANGDSYIAYLFATVAGVSKVGSYTGTGSDQNIDCGFSSGARFVLIKRTDNSENWYVFDTVRGIVSGNDPLLMLNNTTAESSGVDFVDPHSSGFTVVGSDSSRNASGASYIFYAIA